MDAKPEFKFLREKCFELQAKKEFADFTKYPIPYTWLNDFIQQLGATPFFQIHIGPASTYAHKTQLIESLKAHYLILSSEENPLQLSPEKKQLLKNKLVEGIDQCTPGFHIRVDSLLTQLYQPGNIDDILINLRNSLVELAVRQITSEVHVYNYFFKIAKELGYGVDAIHANDPHMQYLAQPKMKKKIQEKLAAVFMQFYQPLNILLEIKKRLILDFSYIGRKNIGYTINEYQTGIDLLKSILENPIVEYEDILVTDEHYTIIDLNWDWILTQLWDKLSQGYFLYDDAQNNEIKSRLIRFIPVQVPSSNFFSWISFSEPKKTSISIFATRDDILFYLEIMEHKNILPKIKIDFIFSYLLSKDLDQETVDFFWDYAAGQSSSFSNEFGRNFITKHSNYWQEEIKRLSLKRYSYGFILKSTFLPKNKKINLFFSQKTADSEYGVQILARNHAKYLPAILRLLSYEELIPILLHRARKNNFPVFNRFMLLNIEELLLLLEQDTINMITSITSKLMPQHWHPNILDNVFLKNDFSTNLVKFLYLVKKISMILSIILGINILENFNIFYIFINFTRFVIFSFSLILFLLSISLAYITKCYTRQEQLININLLPQLLDILFNEKITSSVSKLLWDIPLELIEQEQQKKHNDEVELALSLMKFSVEEDWQDNSAITLSETSALKNNLTMQLSLYANSKKTRVEKTQLKNNWMAYCNQLQSQPSWPQRRGDRESVVAVMIVILLVSLAIRPNSDFFNFALGIFFAHNLYYTGGNKLWLFPRSPQQRVEELKETMSKVMGDQTENNSPSFGSATH